MGDNLLNGYKLNLQQLMGMKIPAGILNFLFKHSYCRKGLAKAKASGFKGYTAEEVEEEGKKDLLVLKEMLGEQQVRRCFDLYIFLETYIFYKTFQFYILLNVYIYFFSFSLEMSHTVWIWLLSAILRRS